jgi:hypothetical protein
MGEHRSKRGAARIIGTVLGLALAVAVVVVSRVPRASGSLGADVTFITNPSGVLSVSQSGQILQLNGLEPADGPTNQGTVTVTNIAPITLAIKLVALPSTVDLNDLLHVRVTAGGDDLFDGTLSGLLAGTPAFRLSSGESADLVVAAWLPRSVSSGYEGRIDDISLQFRAHPEEA